MDMYRKVRLACAEGMSQREAARHFGVSRDSVRKMLAFSVPPGYRRTSPVKRPKLDGFTGIIDGWLEGYRGVHRKQRHTAKRVFERLRDEHGFTGGYTIVKDYMRERERRGREMFVPLAHPPGHAQADFGEATAIIGGVTQKAHFFVMDLPHSDACFVRAYPAATAEVWVDGHIHAFAFFGKVPVSVLYDNDRCLVSKILPDGTRRRAALFSGFLSHYLFRDRYGRPGKGNDKGAAEGLVGYARRNFMVPVPRFASWDAFNDHLEAQCRKRQADVLRGHAETIGERLARDLAAMAEPPAAPFDACDQATGRVSSQSLVRYKANDYSVRRRARQRDDGSPRRAPAAPLAEATCRPEAPDHRRVGLRPPLQDRRRTVVRADLAALRTRRHADHQQPAVRRMDRGVRLRASHRRPARPADPPRQHPRDERRQLPARAEPRTEGRSQRLIRRRRVGPAGQSAMAHAS